MHSRSAGHRKSSRRFTRPAATLIELLVLLALLVVITDFTVAMIRTFAGDIPRSYRDFQTNTTVQNMLRQLRNDVESAGDLYALATEDEAAEQVLAVTLPDGVVLYEFCDGQVCRRAADDDPNQTPSHLWPMPHANVRWQVLARDGGPYALEITTAIERIVLDRSERKLRNSHVFFIGLARGGEN